jgi:hypothetical protein
MYRRTFSQRFKGEEEEMGQLHSISGLGQKLDERLTLGQQELLERAVGKLVLIGEHVGVSVDQMILLLESGLTVRELLEYLGQRNNELS